MDTKELIGLAFIAAAVLTAGLTRWILSRRSTPQERERRRRLAVNSRGRLGDANITDANQSTVYYSYTVGGVAYTSGQDLTDLRAFIPTEPERLVGHAGLKYLPNNPADSILVCEEWSGLPSKPAKLHADAVPVTPSSPV